MSLITCHTHFSHFRIVTQHTHCLYRTFVIYLTIKKMFICVLYVNINFKQYIFKTYNFTSVLWFTISCNISKYPFLVTHFPEDGNKNCRNMQDSCCVSSTEDTLYIYMQFFVSFPYPIGIAVPYLRGYKCPFSLRCEIDPSHASLQSLKTKIYQTLTYWLMVYTYLVTSLLHGVESFLSSRAVLN